MSLTPYHAKYFAFELTKRVASDSVEKLASALVDAQVDLNPHQVEAALFAFRSPLSKGAILADEVGLGKTIEAGLVISQKWAEQKRNILIISPANLRKQWGQELQDKFFLQALILESKSFQEEIKAGNLNPFDQKNKVVICSYQFAKSKAPYLMHTRWDLVVIDEAHRLRNVYKPGNIIARTIKQSLEPFPKVLLTATPLQNSLLELYGLVSIIDDHVFGDLKSFKAQYSRVENHPDPLVYEELKERIQPVSIRTLRRQVLEYIKYTERKAFVFEFFPSDREQQLYNLVSAYLQRPKSYALPASQRKLMTLVMRKLLASSSFAISGTFRKMQERLGEILKRHEDREESIWESYLEAEYEDYDELKDEWGEEEEAKSNESWFTEDELLEVKEEYELLGTFAELAESIEVNAKGEKLAAALESGFKEAEKRGAPKKAIIFTESKRTQEYLAELLGRKGYEGKIVLFNGTNADKASKKIYQHWLAANQGSDKVTGSPTADMRAALVDEFKERAQIMIATEAAAEGINLQFCSIVVNYDMPWNPQRIEQRIGRCHRYGQKYDVIVINFLNKRNAADERVYKLLHEKFNLFNGVFGASDEVLGTIESGVDIERKIAQIYQECRTEEEINESFNLLQQELEVSINQQMQHTKQKLLENFDEEVHEKLRVNLAASREYISKYENMLWNLTKYSLQDEATFDDENLVFEVTPSSKVTIQGIFKLGKNAAENQFTYRIQHPLAQQVIAQWENAILDTQEVLFDYTNTPKKISGLESLVGQSGWLKFSKLFIKSFQDEDYLIASAITDEGYTIPAELVPRFFSLHAEVMGPASPSQESLGQLASISEELCEEMRAYSMEKNTAYFSEEYEKLDHWADDMKISLEKELADLDAEIKLKKSEARKITELKAKVSAQREIKDLEKERNEKRKKLFEAQDTIEQQKEKLLSEVESQLNQEEKIEELFLIRWKII
ncbi:SNF2-related protein [Mongoliitalea daihaiensis]|uniref:SNF2-related protein n=1 Tax=Mongoliitalea daihaiensis TaxID=2782006 RepID=UPI001F1B22CE|nr:SNF2-related protein [Mongoliitalea daihaiensis]UJP65133.1 DEAD/DEAH box helicase family protein [Mongoliitalea daihaiensis]